MEEICDIKLVGKRGLIAKVSAVDFKRASEHRWKLLNEYAIAKDNGYMHQFILGKRPDDIPDDFVIDHKDRNKLNNSRSNLRWVSQSFNTWHIPSRGSSKYKNVSWDKRDKKWMPRFLGKHLGQFDDERKAGWAAAKAAIKMWGALAAESDLLVGPDLFTTEDIHTMQEELNTEEEVIKPVRELPKGVQKHKNKFRAVYSKTHLGMFDTIAEAKEAYDIFVKNMQDKALAEHLLVDIPRDDEGHAAIALSGSKGEGMYTRVPEELWHELTFQTFWHFTGEYAYGCWKGKSETLHTVVYKLLNPDYVYNGDNTIDHIVPENKLDNRKENLREATRSEQARNRGKVPNSSSQYRGVYFHKQSNIWVGRVTIDGQLYSVSDKTENEAARKLNEKQSELLGDKAILITIID